MRSELDVVMKAAKMCASHVAKSPILTSVVTSSGLPKIGTKNWIEGTDCCQQLGMGPPCHWAMFFGCGLGLVLLLVDFNFGGGMAVGAVIFVKMNGLQVSRKESGFGRCGDMCKGKV